jgi:hypothetical protein
MPEPRRRHHGPGGAKKLDAGRSQGRASGSRDLGRLQASRQPKAAASEPSRPPLLPLNSATPSDRWTPGSILLPCPQPSLLGMCPSRSAPSVFEQFRVRMRVGRRAAAQEYQRLSLVRPQFVRNARWYDDAVPGPHWVLLVAESHPAAPVGEQIDLLAPVMKVGDRRAPRRYDRLSQALVARVSRRDTGQLADRGAVCCDEGLPLLSAHDVHRDKDATLEAFALMAASSSSFRRSRTAVLRKSSDPCLRDLPT